MHQGQWVICAYQCQVADFIFKISLLKKKRESNNVAGHSIFLMVDESDIYEKTFANILMGKLQVPTVSCMIDCVPLVNNVSSQPICQVLDDATHFLDTQCSDFALLILDVAHYMTDGTS